MKIHCSADPKPLAASVLRRAWSSVLQRLGYQLGFISFCRPGNIAFLAQYFSGVHPKYYLRALLIGTSSLCAQPLRVAQWLCFGRKISKVELTEPPIFIIGHWRSGTTHLHNLMTQNPAFGYLSMYQAIVPDCSLIGGQWLKHAMARIVPRQRPMDNMVWPMDAPQEEEIPLAKTIPYSFYTQFIFPQRSKEFFDKYVLLKRAPATLKRKFKREYHRLLQIATLHAQGKRLVLKNPVNTARIATLLELYPNAKFVHIVRSPYAVYASTRNLHSKIHVLTALQDVDKDRAEETVLYLYEQLMQRFFAEREQIPRENLVQLRFEDLERDPIGELRRVYTALEIADFDQVQPTIQHYLDAQRSYRKNDFSLSNAQRQRVEQRWAFAFDELGYPRS